MTLDEFIRASHKPRNAYVEEPGWKSLYVRHTSRYTNGLYRMNVLDLANIEAEVKGKGTFRNLVERLRRDYPEMTLFVESVLSKQFCGGLLRMGFRQSGHPMSPDFHLAPEDKLLPKEEPMNLRRLTIKDLDNVNMAQPNPLLPLRTQHGFMTENEELLGIAVFCNFDKDFQVLILAREDPTRPYRAIDMEVSLATREEADEKIKAKLKQWSTKDRATIDKYLR